MKIITRTFKSFVRTAIPVVALAVALCCLTPARGNDDVGADVRVQPGGKTLDHVTLTVDRKVLQLVREPGTTAKLTLTGFCSDGSQRVLRTADAVINARTKAASGNVEVATVEGDKVVPKEGGIATIEAVVVESDKTFKASTDVVVAPYYRDYHQALVLKLFLGMEGDPVERAADFFPLKC